MPAAAPAAVSTSPSSTNRTSGSIETRGNSPRKVPSTSSASLPAGRRGVRSWPGGRPLRRRTPAGRRASCPAAGEPRGPADPAAAGRRSIRMGGSPRCRPCAAPQGRGRRRGRSRRRCARPAVERAGDDPIERTAVVVNGRAEDAVRDGELERHDAVEGEYGDDVHGPIFAYISFRDNGRRTRSGGARPHDDRSPHVPESLDDTDRRLAAAAAAGDDGAFPALAARHRSGLQAHCRRVLRLAPMPTTPCRKRCCGRGAGRGSFEGRSLFGWWLRCIATNTCLDVVRAAARASVVTDRFDAGTVTCRPTRHDRCGHARDRAGGRRARLPPRHPCPSPAAAEGPRAARGVALLRRRHRRAPRRHDRFGQQRPPTGPGHARRWSTGERPPRGRRPRHRRPNGSSSAGPRRPPARRRPRPGRRPRRIGVLTPRSDAAVATPEV